MRMIIILSIIISIVFISCEKETDVKIKQYSNLIDTTIISFDLFEFSFGYFGDEEGISIISYPRNSKSCELLNKQWEERILQYLPQDNFIGIDSIIVKTMRGSDGANPSTDIDTILVVIKVVKDDFHKRLIGKWNWTVSCGGFTGGCWYPNNNNSKQIEFDNSLRYIEKHNDSIINDFQYELLDHFINGNSIVYKIRFINNYDTYLWFANHKLNIQGGDFVEEFIRN